MNLDEFLDFTQEAYQDCEVEVYTNDGLEYGQVAVGGFFTPNPVKPEIEIAVQVSEDYDDDMEIVNDINKLVEEVRVTYEHESRHWYQFEKQLANGHFLDGILASGWDTTKEGYLSNPDELDAFANADLVDFVRKEGWQTAFSSKFSILTDYINVFGKNHKNTKKLIKKAYLVLDN